VGGRAWPQKASRWVRTRAWGNRGATDGEPVDFDCFLFCRERCLFDGFYSCILSGQARERVTSSDRAPINPPGKSHAAGAPRRGGGPFDERSECDMARGRGAFVEEHAPETSGIFCQSSRDTLIRGRGQRRKPKNSAKAKRGRNHHVPHARARRAAGGARTRPKSMAPRW